MQQLRYLQTELEETKLVYEDCVDKFNQDFSEELMKDNDPHIHEEVDNPYDIIDSDVEDDVIHDIYKKIALRVHPDKKTGNEDTNLVFDVSATDVDNNSLTFSCNNSTHLTCNVNNAYGNDKQAQITIIPDENWYCKDEAGGGCEQVVIQAVDDPLVVEDGTITLDEGTSFTGTLSDYVTNVDPEDTITYSINDTSALSGSVTLDSETGEFTYTTPNDFYNGSSSFTFRVTDNVNSVEIKTITVVVEPTPDDPVILDILDQEWYEIDIGEQPYEFTVAATDVDIDTGQETTLTFSCDIFTNSNAYSCNATPETATTAKITLTPVVSNYVGSDTITITVKDEGERSDSKVVNLNILEVNDTPFFSVLPAYDGTPNTAYTLEDVSAQQFTATVTDPDGNITFNLNTTEHFNGTESITIKVQDDEGLFTEEVINVIIENINDRPIANNISVEGVEDEYFTFTLPGVDADTNNSTPDILTYSVFQPSNDGDVVIIENQATFFPNNNFNGPTSFQYQVCDNSGAVTACSLTSGPPPALPKSG